MKRIILLASVMLVISAGTASADYVLIKININQLNFFPAAAMMPGQAAGAAGMAGGQPQLQPPPQPYPGGGMGGLPGGGMKGMPGGGMRGMPGGQFGNVGFNGGAGGGFQPPPPPMGTPGVDPGPAPAIEDPNAKWVSAWVEVKFLENKQGEPLPIGGKPGVGMIFQVDHKWGKKNWMPFAPAVLPGLAARFRAEPFSTTFTAKLNKEKKDKDKNVEKYLHLARLALSRGQMPFFHKAMKEAVELDPKNANVANYVRVQKDLLKPFKTQDPAQAELLEELRAGGYKLYPSEQGHYGIHAQVFATDRFSEPAIKRRLAAMEETLESFYYWFAVQKGPPPQPALPKYRLNAVLCNSKDDFANYHAKWGGVSMVADGFTPRRDNVIVMSAKARLNDPHIAEFETVLNQKLVDANTKLAECNCTITREDLLSGRINENKMVQTHAAIFVGAAQTAVLLSKVLEEEAERGTITHEAVRQLLIASDMFPRNVQIPEWMIEGLAAMFEIPVGAVYPTVGTPSWNHVVSFKHFRNTKKFDKASDVMFNVVTDRYFQDARQLSSEAQDNRDSEALRVRSKQAWEAARSSSWSFVYYLAQNRKLDYLFRYGKELDKLPRDMDLDNLVLQSCFAKAFDMTDPKDARRIERSRMLGMAESWFGMMQETDLEPVQIQNYLMDQRAKLDVEQGGPPVAVTPQPVTPNPFNPPGVTPPIAPQPVSNLVGSTWTGTEGFAGKPSELSLQFAADNKVTLTSGGSGSLIVLKNMGTWMQTGNTVAMKFFDNTTTYTGTINGNQMQGSKTSQSTTWNWSVTNGAGGNVVDPNPAVNPNPQPQVAPPPVVNPMPQPPMPKQ